MHRSITEIHFLPHKCETAPSLYLQTMRWVADLAGHPQQTEAMSRPLLGSSDNSLAGLCHVGEVLGTATYHLDFLKTAYGLRR